MPGFDLSRLCAGILKENLTKDNVGMILLHHGVFTFGDTADESYNRMLEIVGLAEKYLKKTSVSSGLPGPEKKIVPAEEIASLRREVADIAGFPVIMKCIRNSKSLSFANCPDLYIISQQGPATPDHVIRTKRLPLLGRNLEFFASTYKQSFDGFAANAKQPVTMLDPAPRVVLDPQLGLIGLGRTAKDASIAAEIYE